MKGRLLVAAQFCCLAVLVLLPAGGAVTPGRGFTSTVLSAAATVVLALAFIALRPSITVFPEPRDGVPFIRHGIYAWVRHPMYLAVLLFGAAMVCTRWTVESALVWLLLYVDLQLKHRYEDRLLAQRWPDASTYQSQVGALLPRLHVRR